MYVSEWVKIKDDNLNNNFSLHNVAMKRARHLQNACHQLKFATLLKCLTFFIFKNIPKPQSLELLQNKQNTGIPYLGLHNAHWCIMRTPSWPWKSPRKKLVCVYNVHGLLKKIVVGNARIKYQSYIFFSPLSMFHLLGEFKNHLSLFIFNKVAKY